jgi:sugar/nucleoside kinase (ribokinase family)
MTDPRDTAGRSGVIAGGNWIVDHVKIIDAWPQQDTLANILSQTDANGGSPYNILVDLAKMGADFPLEAVGLVGDDADGRLIRAECTALGIKTDALQSTRKAATSYTDVMSVQSTGRRSFFHQRGANALLGPEHFDFATTRAKHFHLGYALLLDRLDGLIDGVPGMQLVFAAAHAAGLTTSLDCVSESGDRFASVVTPVLPQVDVFLANDFEAEKITGIAVRKGDRLDRAGTEAAARRLIELGVRAWVVLHFPEGSCACSRQGEIVWQGSLKVPRSAIRGAAGAGDAFAAGVLLGWHNGHDFSWSLKIGVGAAAACLRDPTCSGSIPSLTEINALARDWGYRDPFADFAPQ